MLPDAEVVYLYLIVASAVPVPVMVPVVCNPLVCVIVTETFGETVARSTKIVLLETDVCVVSAVPVPVMVDVAEVLYVAVKAPVPFAVMLEDAVLFAV